MDLYLYNAFQVFWLLNAHVYHIQTHIHTQAEAAIQGACSRSNHSNTHTHRVRLYPERKFRAQALGQYFLRYSIWRDRTADLPDTRFHMHGFCHEYSGL